MRSLLVVVLALVVGIVILFGWGMVTWIAAEDERASLAEAEAARHAEEAELRELASVLLSLSRDTAGNLVEASERAWQRWLGQEPLSLYRDPEQPDQVDVEAIQAMLLEGIGWRGIEERERLRILTDRLAAQGDARIDASVETLQTLARERAAQGVAARRARLLSRFGLLLVGLAVLLGVLLVVLVLRPIQRLRGEVNRIAAGDLGTPVRSLSPAPSELMELARDVEAMRAQIAEATAGLEEEVARQTRALEATLRERTAALSALEATKARLVQSAKMAGLGTLAGGVAHEFNNLVGGIMGCIESARSATSDAGALDDLAMASKTAGRAATLVRALLDVARPGGRGMAEVPLRPLIEDTIRTASPTASRVGVEVGLDAGDDVHVSGDEGQLHQVVLNLVTNALQATPAGGAVRIRVGHTAGHGFVEVTDQGAGVAVGERDRIFEPFYTDKPEGTGLGLFVSYGIVERHGGVLSVEDAPGGGARFRVELPLASGGPPVAEEGA